MNLIKALKKSKTQAKKKIQFISNIPAKSC